MNMCLNIYICMRARRIFDKFRFGKIHSMVLEYNIVDYIDIYNTCIYYSHVYLSITKKKKRLNTKYYDKVTLWSNDSQHKIHTHTTKTKKKCRAFDAYTRQWYRFHCMCKMNSVYRLLNVT